MQETTMTSEKPSTGVLLVNIGTPDSPHPRDVRRYLAEFLSDPLVIDLPWLMKNALLYGMILPFRTRRSAKAYDSIWTPAGSPLLLHSKTLARDVQTTLGNATHVELAMRYGNPSMHSAIDKLLASGVQRIIALPLYPQYSSAATESTAEEVAQLIQSAQPGFPFEVLGEFYAEPGFRDAFVAVSKDALKEFGADYVLFSYHGLPERQIRRADPTGEYCLKHQKCCTYFGEGNQQCYRAQCLETTRLLAENIPIPVGYYSSAFQSRLGITPWIKPYTDHELATFYRRGVRRLAVICPSFVADCLETLEEVGLRLKKQWIEMGGEDLLLLPSLNSHPVWVNAVSEMIGRRINGSA